LWTDHGFHLGDKDTWEKFTLWEESTRVPLVFVAPGITRASTRCSRPASLLDVYPTLADLTGLKGPDHLEGVSLVPQLRNVEAPRKRPAICTYCKGNHSVRGQRYHYIRYANGDEELYDHKKDQGEWNNLAGDPAYAAIKKELASWLPKVNVEPMKKTSVKQ
jgi:arylsulfatase A-like enzyme